MYKISSQTPDDELIRFIIQYWNCVDMIFRQIESFKIMLHITGIIIPRVNYFVLCLKINVLERFT